VTLRQFNRLTMVVFIIVVFVVGCTGVPKLIVRQHTADVSGIERIAVLPFENLTNNRYAAERVRRVVIAEFLSRGLDVLEPGEVTRVLKEKNIFTLTYISTEQLQEIAEELEVEGIILGSVGAYGISKGINVFYPEVAVHLMWFDPSEGKVVWSVWGTEGGPDFWTRHFGAEPPTIHETLQKVVKEMVDTLYTSKK